MKTAVSSLVIGIGLSVGGGAIASAQMTHEALPKTQHFSRLEQPLWLKGAVTTGGLGLIGLELWWFLFSKPKSRQATAKQGVQEITVIVDGGYNPSQIVVQTGQQVRLNFDRQDPSSCLEEVRLPEFHIAQQLPLNQTTAIEFTPDKPGRYEFTCGMNMYRGTIEVKAIKATANLASISGQATTNS